MPHRILVVEDQADIRGMMSLWLTSQGYEVAEACNGAEGLELLATRRISLVLLDLQMPVMDGWAFRHRQLSEPSLARVPVLCLTAVFDPSSVARTLGLTCIQKPIDFDDLLARVTFIYEGTWPARPGGPTERPIPRGNDRVERARGHGPSRRRAVSSGVASRDIVRGAMAHLLIVDDSPTIRRMVRASLATLPGPVVFDEAASGLEAIERVALTAVDLMVLDLNMPDMHGLEVLAFMRSHARYQRLPIVVLTTRGDASARESALKAGATAFMTKPFTPDGLADQVRRLLGGPVATTDLP
jgi:two-component system chemotaxis response regulator CheY